MKTKKVSEWRKYDRKTNRWIQDYYIVYQFWFQFLQHAERDPTRIVDWSLYKGWGGANVVLGSRFRAWWLDRWVDLFSVESVLIQRYIAVKRISASLVIEVSSEINSG